MRHTRDLIRRLLLWAIVGLAILSACAPDTTTTSTSTSTSNAGTSLPIPGDAIRTLTIFYTSDEHGYLESIEKDGQIVGGAAHLLAILRQRGYDPDGEDALLLSGGDMWTGPAISTWFQGAPAVQVFDALGYDAAAVGNHDFDFGPEALRTNAEAASFPLLTANVTRSDNGEPPDFAQSYTIRQANGVAVGIVGLTTRKTPGIVMPAHIEGLAFDEYAAALRRVVPQARAAGAELVIVIAHVCPSELLALTPVAAELGIPLLAGGHCHTRENMERDGVRVIGAGAHWQSLAQVDIAFDMTSGEAVSTQAELAPVGEIGSSGAPVTPDAEIESLVAAWRRQVDEALGEVIGYTETGVEVGWPLYNLLVDSWLWYYPEADLAINNLGGYREDIPPGEITRADIVATWPFENTLVEVELTGQQVMDNLLCCGGAVAGLTYRRAGARIIAELEDGRRLDPDATYRVLVNNFIYAGGDGYLFSEHDPEGYDTGIPWREPVIERILAHDTSRQHPLETVLDETQRGPRH